MTDTLTPLERSERMSRVRGHDTKPEIRVRKLLHSMGFRFRLHRRDLPGRPDIVLPKYKAIIFVHGCFWHRHDAPNCRLARMPKSRIEFWGPKLDANQLRDRRVEHELRTMGWSVLVLWECEMKDEELLRARILGILGNEGAVIARD